MREINGFMWPEHDKHCAQVIFDQVADLEHALKWVTNYATVVQAGGNCGVWARKLATLFDAVYTFEPDSENFTCLAHNVPDDNVFKYQACLGNSRGLVDLHREYNNCGAYYVERSGRIPTLTIDDLGLTSCGLMILDIEGMEWPAMQGGMRTILEYRPVLMYEDKALSEKFGYKQGDIERFMAAHDYRVVDRIHRDVILCG